MILRDLSIGYGEGRCQKIIQSGINVALEPGEFVCFLGPNGAGKTTLMRTMARFLKPVSGEILIDGHSIDSFSPSELSRQLSIVLTERPEVHSMTVSQLVALGRSPYTGFWGKTEKIDEEHIEKAIAEVGISDLKERLVDSLSDGERQKVMIAKSLAQDTPVILLDEPTAFLDFPSKAEAMMLLREIAHRQKKAVLQSTHDLNFALALADRLWLIDKELGMQFGTPRELACNGQLERYFASSGISFDVASMSFLIRKA